MYVVSLSFFSVLELKNYMMIVFMNERFLYIYLVNILALPLNFILTFIFKVKFWKTLNLFTNAKESEKISDCNSYNTFLHFRLVFII